MNYPLWNKIPKNPTIDIHMFNIDLLIYYGYSETRPYLKLKYKIEEGETELWQTWKVLKINTNPIN